LNPCYVAGGVKANILGQDVFLQTLITCSLLFGRPRCGLRRSFYLFASGTDHSPGRVIPKGLSVWSLVISIGSNVFEYLLSIIHGCLLFSHVLHGVAHRGDSMGTAAIGSRRAVVVAVVSLLEPDFQQAGKGDHT